MFTFENTKKATHVAMTLQGGTGHQFYANIERLSFELISEVTGFSWVVVEASTSYELIELSYPIGERKEDHTDENGVVTYALTPTRQYDDQEAELATHYSGNNNRFYIQEIHSDCFAMVLDDVGRWIYSDCTTNAELDGDEFWKLDANQDKPSHHIELAINAGAINDVVISPDEPVLSEDWLIDHLTDKPTLEQQESVCPGEPVFTQEMCDNGEYPMVGCELMYLAGAGLKLPGGGFSKGYWDKTKVIARHNDLTWLESHGIQEIHYYMIKPIDNRTDDQKAYDDLYLGGLVGTNISKAKDIIKAIKAGKIHGVKWSL